MELVTYSNLSEIGASDNPGAVHTVVPLSGTGTPSDTLGIVKPTSWTLSKTVGKNTLVAVSSGLAGSPMFRTAFGIAGPASAIAKSAGDQQTGVAGQAVATQPAVKVTDVNGNVAAGVPVSFSVALGGGSLTGANATTDALGIAKVGSWTLGSAGATQTLVATAPGVVGPAVFSATVRTLMVVSPAVAAVTSGAAASFSAKDSLGNALSVTWRVNGVDGGTAQAGFIDGNGHFSAPGSLPLSDTVVVTAVLVSDTTTKASSVVVFIVPDLHGLGYHVALPRVVDATHPAGTRFVWVPTAAVTSMVFVPLSGPSFPMASIGNGAFGFELDAGTALAGYTLGAMHNHVGYVDHIGAGGGFIKRENFVINVRDATMPDVAVSSIGPSAQLAPHILNIRSDSMVLGATSEIVSKSLSLLGGDKYDFVGVLANVTGTVNRTGGAVRNDIQGIGTSFYDGSSAYGGAGRLQGVVSYPGDAGFDAAERGTLHEMGHRWMVSAVNDSVLAPGCGHWPPSTMAYGIMGISILKVDCEGGEFPFKLAPLGNGTVRVDFGNRTDIGLFSPMELYILGMLPPDSVPVQYVIPPSIDADSIRVGKILPAMTYTIDDFIAKYGERVPSSAASQRNFSAAFVVMSYGRLLTASEMALGESQF